MGDPTLFPREPRRMKQPTKAVLRARLAAAEESAALLRGENAEIRRRLENPGAMIVVASAIAERIDGTYLTDVSVGEHRFGDVMVRPAAAPALIAFPFEPHIGFGHIRDTGELLDPAADYRALRAGSAPDWMRTTLANLPLPEGMAIDADGNITGVPAAFTRERVSPHLPEPVPEYPPPPAPPPVRVLRGAGPRWWQRLLAGWGRAPGANSGPPARNPPPPTDGGRPPAPQPPPPPPPLPPSRRRG